MEGPEGDLDKAVRLAGLRAMLRRLEQGSVAADRPPLVFGLPSIDDALGGGLSLGCLHEIVAAVEGDDAATGFCAALLGRLAADSKPILWIGHELYAPGLLAFGLDPGRLITVDPSRPADRLTAMEEGMRCSALAAVLCESDLLDLTAGRRLQLAAEAHGVTGLLLCRQPPPSAGQGTGRASAAVTRWRIAAAPSAARRVGSAQGSSGGSVGGPPLLGRPRWRVELLRCRGGRTGEWLVEWRDETGDFALAAALCDGSAAPARNDILQWDIARQAADGTG